MKIIALIVFGLILLFPITSYGQSKHDQFLQLKNITVFNHSHHVKFDIPKGANTLSFVNGEVNKVKYVTDPDNYHVDDYWATPEEFFKNGGDCEDFAIAKYYILKDHGFDPKNMAIMIVHVKSLNIEHAVLAVKKDNQTYILDNRSKTVYPLTFNSDYQPIFQINETSLKVFGQTTT